MRMTVMMPMLPMRMFNYRPILQYMRMCLLFLGHNIPLSLSEYPILYRLSVFISSHTVCGFLAYSTSVQRK